MRNKILPQNSIGVKTVEGIEKHDSQQMILDSKEKSKDRKEEEDLIDGKPKTRPQWIVSNCP